MTEDVQARRLAEWLAAPAGTDPPEDLDPEVLAAVFALRPDLAPAPRVGIDAILASVSTGPFAVPSAIPDPTAEGVLRFPVAANSPAMPSSGEVPADEPPEQLAPAEPAAPPFADIPTAQPAGLPPLGAPPVTDRPGGPGADQPLDAEPPFEDDGPTEEEVRARRAALRVLTPGAARPAESAPPRVEHDSLPARTAGPRRRIPVWLYPALAVGFAAAASLTLIVPVALQEARKQAFAPPTTSEAEYPMPSAAPAAERSEAKPAEKASDPSGLAEMAPPPPPALPDTLADAAKDELAAGGAAGVAGGVVTQPAVVPVLGAQAGPAPSGAAPAPPTEEARDLTEADGVTIAEAKAPARASSAPGDDMDEDNWNDGEDEGSTDARRERSRDEELAKSSTKKASADMAAEAPAPAAPAAGATSSRSYQTTAPTTVTATTTGTALSDRSAAVPFDYDAGWYRAYADVSAAYSLAAQYEGAGNWSAAVEAYRPFWADARLDVAQDSAWRGARAIWAQGRTSEALAIVQNALRRGGGVTVFRVHLLVLKGDLLNASGRASEAARAWAEAAALNRQRSGTYPSTEDMPAASPR